MVADFIVIAKECSGKFVSRSMKKNNQVMASGEEKWVSPSCVVQKFSKFGNAPTAFLHSDCYTLL